MRRGHANDARAALTGVSSDELATWALSALDLAAAIFANRAPKTILGTLQCRMMRQ
jgi:hypothetical protein